MNNVKKQIENEMALNNEAMSQMEIGSEAYLNAAKAQNQLAETANKMKKVDVNALIPGAASVGMFVIYMIFSDTHIMDTRGIQFCKNLFRR